MIKRVQITEIKQALREFPAVALLGARQTGKTTIAKHITAARKNVLYLDMERNSHRQRLTNDAERYLSMNADKLVVIDEVQRIPELFPLLRALIDDKRRNGQYLLLGSSSPKLIKGVSESLAGRIAYIEIGGINLSEARTAKIPQDTLWLKGGFPTPLLSTEKQMGRWCRNFIKSIIQQDLSVQLGNTFSAVTVENFWRMLAGNNGALFNRELYARSLGVTAPTVERYLHCLEGSFLVNKLQPWTSNVSKRLVKMPKLYIRDSGLLHAMNHIHSIDELYGSIHAGASWESFVIEQIRQAAIDCELYFYRTHNGAEADLILTKSDTPIACIEVKLSTSPQVSRGFYEVINDLKTSDNYVIIPTGDSFPLSENAFCHSLNHFIINVLPDILN